MAELSDEELLDNEAHLHRDRIEDLGLQPRILYFERMNGFEKCFHLGHFPPQRRIYTVTFTNEHPTWQQRLAEKLEVCLKDAGFEVFERVEDARVEHGISKQIH